MNSMRELKLIIDEKHSEYTVGQLIKNHFKISSRLLTKLKQNDLIKLNGEHVTVRGTVKVGDELKLIMPESSSLNVIPVNIPIDIVYEDEDLLVVNKPKDMPVHPSMNNYDNTLGNAVRYYFKDIPFVYRPVNRLDRDTTGLVIVAKTPQASHSLSEQMQKNIFRKTYLAIADGIVSPEQGIIDVPIAREQESIIKRCVRDDGQRAITEYKIIRKGNNKSVAEILLHTGRTHQIRVHFAHIGYPLYADSLYGREVPGETFNLHCRRLEFLHPVTKAQLCIECMPPENFDIFFK